MKKSIVFGIFLGMFSLGTTACSDNDIDPNYMPPDIVLGNVESEYPTDLPTPGAAIIYAPSLHSHMYRPLTVKYSSSYPPVTNWKTENTRIIAYMNGYTPAIKTLKAYKDSVNKYGSSVTLPQQTATGRFYTKKINGRWWIVDPEGYLHLERAVCSFRKGSSERNKAAWNSRFGTDEIGRAHV